MINCYILDDEPAAIRVISHYIAQTSYLRLAGSSTSVFEAAEDLTRLSVDLIFLDIQMPHVNGLQFMDAFGGNRQVIITTAHSHFAVDGFDRNVADYLLKPIPIHRFLQATRKVLVLTQRENPPVSAASAGQSYDFIFVKTEHKGKLRRISYGDIMYGEGLKNYVAIHTRSGERIVTYSSIRDFVKRLPAQRFIQVHRSYVVAISAIESIDGGELQMHPDIRIPVSGKFKDQLLEKLRNTLLQNEPYPEDLRRNSIH
jgi:two-component system, LytTR family, response regulator